ncbi:MAG: protein translocase subunit SecDF [Paludibacteraceae bacterium]|nr:protein translocase subunit SecDF [Paludibacteraceae bacterium]
MRNKGLVLTLALLLFAICGYYLSFTFKSNSYKSEAREAAAGDQAKESAYLDSLANEDGLYSLKSCREKELNLGLDLRGGMNVVMEVSVPDILKTLAGNQVNDAVFQNALAKTNEKQQSSQADYLTLFEEAFNEVSNGGKMAAIFSSYELKDKVVHTSTNSEVMKVLREEVNSAIDNSFNVLRSRIDRFGVVQPNIQRLESSSRILIEMPGVKEPERVRKLLQGSADLAFWETTNVSEIQSNLIAVNQMVSNLSAADNSAKAENEKNENASEADSLINTLNADSANVSSESLFKYIRTEFAYGPRLGIVHYRDTAKVMAWLEMGRQKGLIPNSTFFAYTVHEEGEENEGEKVVKIKDHYGLIALKSRSLRGKDRKAPLTGAHVVDAKSDFNNQQSVYASVSMTMDNEGAKTWAKLTRENIDRCVAVVLDGYVYSYPNVNCEITGGRSEITGKFSVNEANDLANVLKCGKMPAPTKIVQEDVVGPSLGQEAINAGLISFVVAFVLVLIYMILYYGLVPGLVADFALICNVFLIFGVLAAYGAVLTLPGIAGIVLTLGMAVDANVLIYERIREELSAGKSMKNAIADGYSNAMSAIIDANVTTILTGIILALFGTGPIKGFATTLIIGIVCSLVTAIFVSRIIFDFLVEKDKCQGLTFSTKLSSSLFKNINFDFIGKAKNWMLASAGFMLVAVISLATLNLKYGIDFTGGRNYIVKFEKPVSTTDIKSSLENAFAESNVNVITIGSDDQVRISTNYRINDTEDNVESDIQKKLYENLKDILSPSVTEDMFVNSYVLDENGNAALATQGTYGIQSSQKVGPTMASDIKISAIIAVLIALAGIGLYILFRFRKAAYSYGAVIALIHDTLFILGIFSLFQSVMNFSLEIDQSFIAAILTVIGYSINDKVVIFDRIREYFGLKPNSDKKEVFNDAINSTLSRTFSTSLSTLIVLVIIFLFGGVTIKGFIFAMLIGVIVGTYSSIFIAAPIAHKFYNVADNEKEALIKAERKQKIEDRV